MGVSGFVADRGRLLDALLDALLVEEEAMVDARFRADWLRANMRRLRILVACADSFRSISIVQGCQVYCPMVAQGILIESMSETIGPNNIVERRRKEIRVTEYPDKQRK